MAMEGLSHGAPKRKKPVTHDMLRWIKAVMVGFFSLLRGSDWKAKRAGALTGQLNRGEWCNHYKVKGKKGVGTFKQVDEAVLRIRGPKQVSTSPATRPGSLQAGASQDVGTHLLSMGGASERYAKFRDTAPVQRWGRWKSAFHCYFWEAVATAKGAAE